MDFNSRRLGIFLIGVSGVAAILLTPFLTVADSVYGKLTVCAYPFNCISRMIPNEQRAYLYDTDDLMGPGNNWAIAEYYSDIARGFVGAWVKATRGWDGVWWRPARASTGTGWEDTLRFKVPAGSYPDGLKVEASGSVGGHVGKSGAGTEAFAGFFARLGSEPSGSFSGKVELQSSDDNQVVVVDAPFVLEVTLIPPGTVLSDSIIVERHITAGFGDPSLAANTWAGGIYEAWSQSDFASSLSVDAITVPPGVTWTSASGVFLTQSVGSCRGDFDGDGDVDGTDSATLALGPDQLDLNLFAAQFGRSDCHH
jgi:hypothetical protein